MPFTTEEQRRIRNVLIASISDVGPAPDLDTIVEHEHVLSAEPPTAQRRRSGAAVRHVRTGWAVPVVAGAAVLVALTVGSLLLLNGGREYLGDVASAPTPTETAIDPAWLTVEATDLVAFEQVQTPGPLDATWRPGLRTETVWCMYANGTGAETLVSNFPLDEDLTLAAIEAECATGTDPARLLETPPDTFTLCRAVFDDAAYQGYAASDENKVLSGGVDGQHPGFPVMLGWESDCASEHLDTRPIVRLDAGLSLDVVNRARTLEIAIRGAAYTNCLSYAQASALAEAARQQLGSEWLHVQIVRPENLNTDGVCFQPFIDPQWGATSVDTSELTSNSVDTSEPIPYEEGDVPPMVTTIAPTTTEP